MKKTALLLTFVLILSMALSSCASILPKPKDADKLWKKVEKAMVSLDSYELYQFVDISHGKDEEHIEATVRDHIIVKKNFNSVKYYHQSGHSKISVANSTTVINEHTLAFDGENIYKSNTYEGRSSKLYSKITEKEFTEFYQGFSRVEIPSLEAQEKSFTKNDDSTYTIKFSDFEQSVIDELVEGIGLNEISEDLKIVDLCIEGLIDKEYRINELKMELYKESMNIPTVTIKLKYGSFNSAKEEEIDESEYDEVTDVRIVTYIRDAITKMKSAESGEFLFDEDRNYFSKGIAAGERTNISNVSYDVKFKNGEKFEYDIALKSVKDEKLNSATTSYKDGKVLTKDNNTGRTVTEKSTDAKARQTVNSILNAFILVDYDVKDIRQVDDGVYRIDSYYMDVAFLEAAVSSLRDRYLSYSYYFLVYMDCEDISKIEIYLDVEGDKHIVSTYGVLELKSYGEEE